MKRFLWLFLLWATPANAQSSEVPQSRSITFEQVLTLAAQNPEVVGTEEALLAREEGDDDITDFNQPLVITLQPGMRVLPETDRGFEGQATVVQSWHLEGLGHRQRQSARVERDSLQSSRRLLILESQLRAAQAWLRLRTAGQCMALLEAEAVTAERRVAAETRLLELGEGTRSDVAEARVRQAEVHQLFLAMEARAVEASLELSRSIGQSPIPLIAEGPLPQPSGQLLASDAGVLARIDQMAASVSTLPPALRADLEYQAALLRVSESNAANGSTFQFGAQVQRESPSGLMVFGVVGLTWQLGDPSARQRSQLTAEARRLEVLAAAERISLMIEIETLRHDVVHSAEALTALEETVLPALTELSESRQRLLSLGEADLRVVLDAEARLTEARIVHAELQEFFVWHRIQAWLMSTTYLGEAS